MKRVRTVIAVGALAAGFMAAASPADAAGKGPQPPRPCTTEAGMASDLGPDTTVTFVNETDAPVQVYWLNYAGERVLYHPGLGAGSSYLQPTFASHPWVVTDAAGECLAVFMATGNDTTAVVG